MRNVVLLAVSLGCTLIACDRTHPSGDGATPDPPRDGRDNRGGGPARNDPPMVIEPPTSASAQPSAELPGMPDGGYGPATESNGGSGAGATGSKGQGESLHNGMNPKKSQDRPDMKQKPLDLGPGEPHPRP